MEKTYRDWLGDPSLGLVRTRRESQLRMADIVQKVIEEGGIAFVEAGTGTGKSLAYGVPSFLAGRRVVISTAKKALQDQLTERDIPAMLQSIKPTTFVGLKGRSNYLCQMRWDVFKNSAYAATLPPNEMEEFDAWVEGNNNGDLSSWNTPWVHHARVNECVKRRCDHKDSCVFLKEREKAKVAQIVIVNHALLAQDLVMGGGKLFGAYDVLVIDEAHQAPKFFRDAYSLTMHPRQPEQIGRLLQDTSFELRDNFKGLYDAAFQAVGNVTKEIRITEAQKEIFALLELEAERVHHTLVVEGIVMDEDEERRTPPEHLDAAKLARLRIAGSALKGVRDLCRVIQEKEPEEEEGDEDTPPRRGPRIAPEDWIKYVEKSEHDIQIIATPVDVGALVAPAIRKIRSVVITSATLATTTGMKFIAREYGLEESQIAQKAVLPSPFPYTTCSALYVSETAPDASRRDENYFKKLCAEIHELLTASRGGAFVLCAATEDVKKIHDGIYRDFDDHNYRLGMQTNASLEALTTWFKSDPTNVLIATKTFWEGVDIPGDALRLVVIPRLPFPNPKDVVLAARKKRYSDYLQDEKGENETSASVQAWDAFDFQMAIMDLKQGAGRLIRTETDRGIVAVLDYRAFGRRKMYSSKVRGSLPHPQTTDKAKLLKLLTYWGDQALARRSK